MNKGVYHCHQLGFFLLVLCLRCQEGDISNFWWPDVCVVLMCACASWLLKTNKEQAFVVVVVIDMDVGQPWYCFMHVVVLLP